ncbi:ribonuclease H domain-containing protein [Tanacetum coccineum]
MVGRHVVVELETLIEGLNAAAKLGLKRVHVYCDNVSVYRYLTGEHGIIGVSVVGARIWLNSLKGATISIADVDMSFATRVELSTSVRKQRAQVSISG